MHLIYILNIISNLVNECHMPCSTINSKFINNIQILNHLSKLLEADLPIMVLVSFDDGSIYKLLELDVTKIVSNHHLECCEQLSVWNETIAVDIINLESESKLLFLRWSCWQRIQTLYKFQEWNASIFVLVKHRNHPFDKRVVGQLRNIKELFWF